MFFLDNNSLLVNILYFKVVKIFKEIVKFLIIMLINFVIICRSFFIIVWDVNVIKEYLGYFLVIFIYMIDFCFFFENGFGIFLFFNIGIKC